MSMPGLAVVGGVIGLSRPAEDVGLGRMQAPIQGLSSLGRRPSLDWPGITMAAALTHPRGLLFDASRLPGDGVLRGAICNEAVQWMQYM